MCIGHMDKNNTGWRLNLSVAVLCLFVLLGPLGSLRADDSQARIMEKIIALEATLQELMAKVEDLGKRVKALEKGAPARRVAPRVTRPKKGDAKKKAAKKLIDIGHGFYVSNLEYKSIVENTIFTGDLENSGGRDYQFVLIKVIAYDKKGKLLGDNALNITGMFAGSTRPFKITLYGVNTRDVADFDIKFVKGF